MSIPDGITGPFTASPGLRNATPEQLDFIPIKRLNVAASAGHSAQVDSETGTGYYAVNQKWLERRGLNANSLSVISVRGDSMEPDLHENDLLLLDHAQTDQKDSHIYAVRFSSDLYVKRIQHLPGGQVHLISRSSAYPPITVKNPETDGVKVIRRMVALMHEW
jgi:phage repressor protein C with HTH and peptisase S24 domain